MKTEKNKIRIESDRKFAQLTPQDIRDKSRTLFLKFQQEFLPNHEHFTHLLAFVSMPNEVQTDFFLQWAYTSHVQVALPRISAGDKQMTFHCVRKHELPSGLEQHKFGFLQPKHSFPLINPDLLIKKDTLLLVPGTAFTHEGERTGRGGGYYDRFLQAYSSHVTAVGICFREQIFYSLPVEDHDMFVDLVITDQSVGKPMIS
jgi:5-formyltetrahydrofolate cyclo-ligase